jgi:hypothetical protein
MEWLQDDIAEMWRAEGKRYASEINVYVNKGMTEGWDSVGEEPAEDDRSALANKIFKMIKGANEQNEIASLRALIPAATWPLAKHFEKEMQAIRGIHFLGQDEIVFSTGTSWEENKLMTVKNDNISVFNEYSYVGASPDKQFYALSGKKGIKIIKSMDWQLQGEIIAQFSWTELNSQIQALSSEISILGEIEPHEELPLEEVIPFQEGKALLLVTGQGIFYVQLAQQMKVTMLHPDLAELKEYDLDQADIDMAHGAVSSDGRWIAFGSQSSDHLLYDVVTEQTYNFYPNSSYPHYSIFTKDQQHIWYNACHFYNGDTIAVSLDQVVTGEMNKDQEWPSMNEDARVYAAVALEQGIVIGDAYGYLKLIDTQGQEIWRHFVGSTISALAVDNEEKTLAVGTYGGMLHFLALHVAEQSEYEIGTGYVREVKRILAWNNQEKPLWW